MAALDQLDLDASTFMEGSLKSAEFSGLTAQRKQTPLINKVVTHTTGSRTAIDSDSEDGYIDASAIDDDDDSSDWEDIIEDSGKFSVDEKYFQRVDSKANVTSRRSLIALMLQSDAQSTLAISRGHAGRSALTASPNGSDDAPLIMKIKSRPIEATKEISRSTAKPIAIPTHGHTHTPPLSQRTTRSNMLDTELTDSLRWCLLLERFQTRSTVNAVRSGHTHDVASLKQDPERVCMENDDRGSFDWLKSFKGYHDNGW